MGLASRLHDVYETLAKDGHNPIQAMITIARTTSDERLALEANHKLAQLELAHAKLLKEMQTAPVSFVFNAPKEMVIEHQEQAALPVIESSEDNIEKIISG